MPPEEYVQLIFKELEQRSQGLTGRTLRSVYFGGGTPSLIPPDLIVSIIDKVASHGFQIDQSTEVTIEINPATVSKKNLEFYLENGVNRFSVGAQTFDDDLLKLCGREHTAEQTRETLRLLQERGVNYSFDLLFALPGQSLAGLENDLNQLREFEPQHLSAYCLTVPTGHPMSKGRPPEGEQIQMFKVIEERLKDFGIFKYEISNFCKPGFQSRHNTAYWDNSEYWGLGLSAHSYLKSTEWGTRFWNPKSFDSYAQQVELTSEGSPEVGLPTEQVEALMKHEAMTDTCHMYLRMVTGLPKAVVRNIFDQESVSLIGERMVSLVNEGLICDSGDSWTLSEAGTHLSNKAFERLTFLPEEV